MRRQHVVRGSAAMLLAGWIAAIVVQGQEQAKDGRGLVRPQASAGAFDRGRKWAVIIGVNEYLDQKIPDLKYCVADAHLVADKLVERCGYDDERILLIADDQPKAYLRPMKRNLHVQVPEWLKRAEAGDTVLVFFAGHGFLDARGQGFLATQECEPDNLGLTSLRTDELRDMLRQCKATQKLMVLDCCHSGGERGIEVGPSSQELGASFQAAQGLITLASCRKQETSREWEAKGHGLFTYFLAEGLSGAADLAGNKDGLIDSDELYNYTVDRVSLVGQRELNAKQTPVRVIGEDVVGRFLLARIAPSGKIRVNDPKGAAGTEPVTPDLAAGGTGDLAKGSGRSSMAKHGAPSANPSSTVRKPAPLPVAGTRNTEGGFLRLFNGKDLSGWRLVGNAKHSWSVSGGLLEASAAPPPSSILTTVRTDFANFHLRVEMMVVKGIASGIWFRMMEPDSERARHYSATINTARPDGKKTLHNMGSLLFDAKPGPTITLAEADAGVSIKPGEWFTEEVIAEGDVLTVIVQGIEVAKFQVLHRKLTSGAIGLCCHALSRVVFRTIEIKELEKTEMAASPTSGLGSSEGAEAVDSRRAPTEMRGDWRIENGQLVHKTLAPNAAIFFGDATWTDYTFSADVQLVESTAHAGLFFRNGGVRGRGDYYYIVPPAGDGRVHLWRYFDGEFHLLAGHRAKEAALTLGKWHKMRIDVQGKKFTAYFDGKEVLTASDDAMATGCVGLKAQESICRFRNIKVTAPDGKILWTGLPELPNSSSIGVPLRTFGRDRK